MKHLNHLTLALLSITTSAMAQPDTIPVFCDSSNDTEIRVTSLYGRGVSVRGDFSASTGFHWESKQNLPWSLQNVDIGNGAPGSGSASLIFEISPDAMKKYGGFFNPNRSKFTFYFRAPGAPRKTVATCVVRVIVGSN